jgi:hypothetical protein
VEKNRFARVQVVSQQEEMLMKTALFAAALLIGGAAFAQQPADDPAVTGSQTAAPGNANPERDARGIPVVSDPAEVPAGANESTPIAPGAVFTPNPNQQSVFAPRPAAETYRACSRTVTDNCVQTYERGVRRPG